MSTEERERLLAQLAEAREALALHVAWADSEHRGPDYGSLRRDTHPDGEKIWSRWWNGNLDLCARAEEATRVALSRIDDALAAEPEARG